MAFNTLVFSKELEGAVEQIEVMGRAGVDAVIVQDLGVAKLVKEIAPEIEVHASTQMTISSPEGLEFVDGLIGLDRAVLAREMSVEEIGRVKKASEVPLEVFVHGALCVAYSGQCLTSESLGQRSANRGECAQACRMPYELVVDGGNEGDGRGEVFAESAGFGGGRFDSRFGAGWSDEFQDRGAFEVAGVCRGGDAGLSQGFGRGGGHGAGSLYSGDDVFAWAFHGLVGRDESSQVDPRIVGEEAGGVCGLD